MKWTEGLIHVAMRVIVSSNGWKLIAGEYPGGSDHELYPLNVVDPLIARDQSPDPRRHSLGELIPDLVALRGRELLIAEAKARYDQKDRDKLTNLVSVHRDRLRRALKTFARERGFPELEPVETLILRPTLVFSSTSKAPAPPLGMSYLKIVDREKGIFEGTLRLGNIP